MRPAVALVGDPVAHSISPPMQRAAFEAVGIDMEYAAVRLSARDLARAFPVLAGRFLGLNVTRPLKEAIVEHLDDVTPEAWSARSVNTVVFRGGRALGASTDGEGFLAALRRVTSGPVRRALLIGTGGAARAVAAALLREGAEVSVTGRNRAAAGALAADLPGVLAREPVSGGSAGQGWLDGADLLVNATPVGGLEDPSASPVPAGASLPASVTVADLVYLPRRTALLTRAAAAGCTVVEGIDMLIEQGARSFEMWTGRAAPVEAMRRAAYAEADAVAPDAARARS